MRIFHVIENLEDSYGGPAKSVPALAKGQQERGHEIKLISGYKKNIHNELISRYELEWLPYKTSDFLNIKLGLSFRLFVCLYDLCRKQRPDLIHFHNLWNFTPLFGFIVCKLLRIPYVISTRGAISKWSLSQGKFRKYLSLLIFQRKMLEQAKFIHVTSKDEFNDLRAMKISNKAKIIPNATNLSIAKTPKTKANLSQYIFIGRINKKKNLHTLINTFKQFNKLTKSKLLIVGPIEDKQYFLQLKKMSNIESPSCCISFLGQQDHDGISKIVKKSSFLILPSFSENFGMVILESLCHGLPVIVSEFTPWKRIEDYKAGFVCGVDQASLIDALNKSHSLTNKEYKEMSKNAINLASEYSLDSISLKMLESYSE